MTIKKYIFINSRDRISGTSSDFIIKLRDFNFQNVQEFKIIYFSMPYSFYNYSDVLQNNTITIDEGGGPILVTLSNGQYSRFSIITALENALNSAGTNTYTVTIDSTTLRTTISATGNFQILWASGQTSYMYKILGFDPVDTGSSSSHTGANSYDFSGPGNIYLRSTKLSTRAPCLYNGSITQYLLKIPVGCFKAVTQFQDTTDFNTIQIASNNMNIDTIDFGLYFDNEISSPVDLNGKEFTFTLMCVLNSNQ